MDPRRAERETGVGARADAGGCDRNVEGRHRPAAEARDGRRIPRGVHRRRSAAVGRGRTVAPDVAHSAKRRRIVRGRRRSAHVEADLRDVEADLQVRLLQSTIPNQTDTPQRPLSLRASMARNLYWAWDLG